ncbi:uncharacterized protein BCR38DRAFT_459964 [Pseudomassariella vexata]|uniref:NodB homology domain-containing protein n=1 Tax=Pseudomassariella vexata TaxID=1141098 RepID=A0A1Y2DL47_9PEZI|nr:uncharacterized protein BCR38DRAFT_459964 [Pseudomassariella vexata]ORY59957.1 hypothetical protein BCR38DRAFT_459964 [Pseudomassariella vexata]
MHIQLLFGVVLLSHALAAPLILERQSSIPYGTVITRCTQPGVVALTFDDGPFIYTEELLDTIAASGFRVTFFVNGNNYDNINNHASTIQRMVAEGHQVGSHTWDHGDLATMDTAGITSEMTQLEDALVGILGFFPQYMRPPYFSYNDNTLATLGDLGYHVIQADIDTLDWQNSTPSTIGGSEEIYEEGLENGGTLSLMHDVYQTTVETLVPQAIKDIQGRGLTSVTVGECLGDPAANWYRTSR